MTRASSSTPCVPFDPQLDFRAAFAALDTPSFSLRSGRALQWLDALWSDAGLPGHVGELAHGRWNNRRGRASPDS